jgi:Maltokinase N-terminal cap domain
MAFIHRRAEVVPGKLELLADWLPGQPWYPGIEAGALARVAACRFDDPAGEVGVETMLVSNDGGPVLHVPVTYRGAPLEGAEAFLIGTTHHTALGSRWVYDACGDPVYAQVLAHAIRTGGTEAEEEFEVDGVLQSREPLMRLAGSGDEAHGSTPVPAHLLVQPGDPTVVVTPAEELVVARVLGDLVPAPGAPSLSARWEGQDGPVVLAYALVG